MSITENKERIGNFTSSEIYKLITTSKDGKGLGKPAIDYIEEKNMERRLKRCIDSETNARPVSWGKILEGFAFEQLGLEYRLCSQETIVHPEIPFWAGSVDGEKLDIGKTIAEIKCPMTLKSFCQLVDPIYDGLDAIDAMEAIRESHKDGDKYYWQTVSNAILSNSRYAELIVCVPYFSQLEEIREYVRNYDGNQNPIMWISYAEDNELPYIVDGGYYKNITVVRFEVPKLDKELLTQRILMAGKMLINNDFQKETPPPVYKEKYKDSIL